MTGRKASRDGARRIYGFVEAAARREEGRDGYARANVVFDGVDADRFDDGTALNRAPEHLFIVRLMTTPKRLSQRFNLGPISEGSWFELGLQAVAGEPPAWLAAASRDYGEPVVRTNVVSMERIGGEGLTRPGGARSSHPLHQWCDVASPSPPARTIQFPPPKLPFVRILDVGHASCAAIHDGLGARSRVIGYYDVGAPVFFHSKSFPKVFTEPHRIPKSGFVILSHWDFDHYSLAVTKMKALQRLDWYAPHQVVGPNAARLQDLLGSRLRFIRARHIPVSPSLSLWRGKGPAADRNNSGYVLRVMKDGCNGLLTGDVAYDAIPMTAKHRLNRLGITHHGGGGCDNPPPSIGRGKAVVSYGKPNKYGHPKPSHIQAHGAAGWRVSSTAASGSKGRGDVWLL